MKRFLALLTLLTLLLSGCAASAQGVKEPVTFYYLLEDYAYGQDPRVFAPEVREAAGHQDDLKYLLTLYMIGPSEEGHLSPLPRSTRVETVRTIGNGLFITITDSDLSDAAFTRASACLTLTCLELTDVREVTVRSGQRSVTMSRDNLVLEDNTPMTTEDPS